GVRTGQTSGILSLPVTLDEELASHLQMMLRHLHDVDVQPFGADLERVIAHVDPKGVTRIADVDNMYNCEYIDADFEASYPELIELHYSVKIPKQGAKPPISFAQLAAKSNGLGFATWSLFRQPDPWS